MAFGRIAVLGFSIAGIALLGACGGGSLGSGSAGSGNIFGPKRGGQQSTTTEQAAAEAGREAALPEYPGPTNGVPAGRPPLARPFTCLPRADWWERGRRLRKS